jgi:hypothetical protein
MAPKIHTRAKSVAWWFAILLLASCDDSSNGGNPKAPIDSARDAALPADMDGGEEDGGNPPIGPSKDSGIAVIDSGAGGTGGRGAGGSGGKAGVKPGKPERTCPAVKPCDIAKSACRDAVLELTACIRGSELPPQIPVRTITSDQLRMELQARASELGLQASPWDTALMRLGLLAPNTSSVEQVIEQAVQSVTAFYEHDPQRVTLIDSVASMDPSQQMFLLSHEYAHYMQDLEVGLAKLRKQYSASSDATTAGSALIEGEAVVSARRALGRIDGENVADVDFEAFADSMLSDMLVHVAASDGALQAANETLPFPVGIRYVASVWNAWDRMHVDALFMDAPMSLVDWIHGYGDGMIAPSLLQPLDCGVPDAPDGFVPWASDSLGAAGALALLAVTASDMDTSTRDFTLIGKLRGDTIAVYATNTGATAPLSPVVVAWRLRFADAKSATAFAARAEMLQLTTQVSGREVLLTGGDQSNPLTGTALDACPKALPLHRPPHADILAAALRDSVPR